VPHARNKTRRYFPPIFALTAILAIFPHLAQAQSPPATSETVVFSDVRVIDGQGGPPLEHGAVVIAGDHILWVGPASEGHWPKSARVLHLSGKTVLPGLISDHSHVGQVDGAQLGSQNYNRGNILRQLRQYEVYGVTTVTALGLNGELFYELRAQLHAGTLPGADLFGADRGIGIPSGAPPNPPFNLPPGQLYRVTTPQEAIEAVDEMATRKPDLIKVWVDDIHGTMPAKMSPEIYGAAIKEAHRLGLRAASHIYDLGDAKSLVAQGVDIIAHGVRDQPVDPDFISAMKARSVWYIPTIALDDASYIFAEHPDWLTDPFLAHALQPSLAAQFADPAWRSKILGNQKQVASAKAAVLTGEQNVKTLFDAGVRIGFGTDSGAMPLRVPGWAEHRELQLLVDAGLTPLQAIRLATANAAALLDLHDRGIITSGKLADFLVVDGNPAAQIQDLNKITAVYHRGKLVSNQVQDFTP
jgi:imidazolonepropionase-like amidohydrolase